MLLIFGQSQVRLRSVSGQSQVSLRSVSGQSQVSLRCARPCVHPCDIMLKKTPKALKREDLSSEISKQASKHARKHESKQERAQERAQEKELKRESLNVSGILYKSFNQIRVTICLYGQGEGDAVVVFVVVVCPLLHPGPGVRRVRGERVHRPVNTGL